MEVFFQLLYTGFFYRDDFKLLRWMDTHWLEGSAQRISTLYPRYNTNIIKMSRRALPTDLVNYILGVHIYRESSQQFSFFLKHHQEKLSFFFIKK